MLKYYTEYCPQVQLTIISILMRMFCSDSVIAIGDSELLLFPAHYQISLRRFGSLSSNCYFSPCIIPGRNTNVCEYYLIFKTRNDISRSNANQNCNHGSITLISIRQNRLNDHLYPKVGSSCFFRRYA